MGFEVVTCTDLCVFQVQSVSMGSGQEDAAQRALELGLATGQWVLLQNCHLSVEAMGRIPDTLAQHIPHSDFRLILTSEPCATFPLNMLHCSVKVW